MAYKRINLSRDDFYELVCKAIFGLMSESRDSEPVKNKFKMKEIREKIKASIPELNFTKAEIRECLDILSQKGAGKMERIKTENIEIIDVLKLAREAGKAA